MRLTCLVDNAVQTSAGCWGEHGLAYLVEAACQRIHFDTGQSGTVLAHNLKLFGIDPATVKAVTISHAHYAHTGGLPPLLGQLRPGIPFFANADLFRERFSQQDGAPKRTPALTPECSADASISLPLNRAKPADRLDTKAECPGLALDEPVRGLGRRTGMQAPRHLLVLTHGQLRITVRVLHQVADRGPGGPAAQADPGSQDAHVARDGLNHPQQQENDSSSCWRR